MMDIPEPLPDPQAGSADTPTAIPPSTPKRTADVPARIGVIGTWALSAGLVAGLVAWLAGESIRGLYEIPAGSERDFSRIVEFGLERQRLLLEADLKGGAWTFGILGAALGLALGLAGGLARRNPWAALTAAPAGLILGGAVGAGMALGMVRLYYLDYNPHSNSLLLPLLVHGGIWSTLGLVAGTSLGIGLGGRGRILQAGLGGLLGAILATLIYEVVGALAFPMAKTHHPVSEDSTSRLFADLTLTLLVAAGAVFGAQDRASKAVRK
jgi:hypothetical protein